MLRHRAPLVWVRSTTNDAASSVRSSKYTELRGEALNEVVAAVLSTGSAGSVHDLARRAGVSVATASRVTGLLADMGLVKVFGTRIQVRDDVALVREWAEAGGFARRSDLQRYAASSLSESAVRAIAEGAAPAVLTGTWAYCIYRGLDPEGPSSRELWLYSEDPERVVHALGLTPDPVAGNVRIAPRTRRLATSDRLVDGMPLVSPWRVIADLLSAEGQRAALAELLHRHLCEDACDLGAPLLGR